MTFDSYHNKPVASQHLFAGLEHILREFRHSFSVIGNYQVFLRIKSRAQGFAVFLCNFSKTSSSISSSLCFLLCLSLLPFLFPSRIAFLKSLLKLSRLIRGRRLYACLMQFLYCKYS